MNMLSKGRLPALLLASLICISCGDTYRPTIVPNPVTPPDPQNFHAAFTANSNGAVNPGSALQLDSSGDTNAGTTKVGIAPVHIAAQAGSVATSIRVWAANPGSDSVSVFSSAGTLGQIGTATTLNLEPGAHPVFIHSTENSAMYVANAGNGTVNAMSTGVLAITATIPVGTTPWALAETPDGHKLYAVNRDSNNVTSINTTDRSIAATIPVGVSPQWAAARSDSKRVYVLASDGTLSSINSEFTSGQQDTVVNEQVGGASFFYYDNRLNRLWVPHSTGTTVGIFDAAADPPRLLNTIDLTAPITAGGSDAPCPAGCTPVGVTALQDGTRAYIVSYALDSTTSNCITTQVVGQVAQPCVALQVTVIDETNNTVRSVIRPPEFAAGSPVTTTVNCATDARFRLFAVSSADSTRVHVASCDAGGVLTFRTSDDTYVTTVKAPVSVLNPIQYNPNNPTSLFPPPQSPLFLIAGP
jgi:YVTN family beta-propeller protein